MLTYEKATRCRPCSTYYSAGMNARQLLEYGKSATALINRLTNRRPHKALLLYRGMSGITAATAIILAQIQQDKKPSAQMYIRKDNEYSHGDPVEHNLKLKEHKNISLICFVDDFIAGGGTLKACLTKLHTEYPSLSNTRTICILQEKYWESSCLSYIVPEEDRYYLR